MKKILGLAVAIALSPALFPVGAIAQDCNYLSYIVSRDGRCIDLTHLSEQGERVRRETQDAIARTPIVARGMRVVESRELELHQLTGALVNQSQRPYGVLTATFEITRQVDGQTEIFRTVTVEVNAIISPGSPIAINHLLVGGVPDQRLTIRLVDIDPIPL